MSTQVFHALVGYDKVSERVAAEYELPTRELDHAKKVAGVGDDDPDAVMCYPLSPSQANDIAGAIGARLDTDALIFYLEGFDAPLDSAT